jgi:hypothetical protein
MAKYIFVQTSSQGTEIKGFFIDIETGKPVPVKGILFQRTSENMLATKSIPIVKGGDAERYLKGMRPVEGVYIYSSRKPIGNRIASEALEQISEYGLPSSKLIMKVFRIVEQVPALADEYCIYLNYPLSLDRQNIFEMRTIIEFDPWSRYGSARKPVTDPTGIEWWFKTPSISGIYGRVAISGNGSWLSKFFAPNANEFGEITGIIVNETLEQAEDGLKFQHKNWDAKMQALRQSTQSRMMIKPYYYEGEYLSGWMLHGDEAKALEKLGLAHYVSGWGYHVDDQIIKVLGEEFTIEQAEAYMKPIIEAEKKRKEEIAAKKADVEKSRFEEAKRTGKPVVLKSWSEECDGSVEECDIDNITIYANPDGTTKKVRSHAY